MIPTENEPTIVKCALGGDSGTHEPSNDVTPDPLAKMSMANSSSLASPISIFFPFKFPPGSKHSKWTPSAMNIRMGRKDRHRQ